MSSRLVSILLFWLLFTGRAAAQEQQDVVLDTVPVMMPPDTEEMETGSFDSIQSVSAVTVRTVPQRLVDSLKAADEFWYASLERKKKQTDSSPAVKPGRSWLQQAWFRSLLWIVILGSFIGVVIWYLAASNILLFRRGAKKINGEESQPEDTDDIFSLSYDKEIAAAEAAGNYRLAVRLWYLRLLTLLSDSRLIDYRFGRTNQDYVSQLSQSSYYRSFFRLTRNFEYTWYGQFTLSAAAYEMMRNDFVTFKNSLPR